MTNYKINWMERKATSTGKQKIDAELEGANGPEKGVTIWSDFPDFENLAPGRDVEGDVVTKQNGQYTNKTLYPIKPATGGFKGGGGVKAAQERKGEMIKEAQERKEESIAFFNATNSAITLMSSHPMFNDIKNSAQLRQTLIMWRNWFYNEWLSHEIGTTKHVEVKKEKVEDDIDPEDIPF